MFMSMYVIIFVYALRVVFVDLFIPFLIHDSHLNVTFSSFVCACVFTCRLLI